MIILNCLWWCLLPLTTAPTALDTSPMPVEADARHLVWPPTVETGDIDSFEGIACLLAMRAMLTTPEDVVDIHRLRRHLNDAGLSITAPLSLASKLKTAAELGARELWVFTIHGDHYRMHRFDTASLDILQEVRAAKPGDWEQLPQTMADHMDLARAEAGGYEFYRLWASVYFVDDLTNAQNLMVRLAAHPAAGSLFLQELTDLFGNPAVAVADVQDIVAWRDRFYEQGLFAAAEKSSLHLLEQRHNPGDLLDHARILLAQGKRNEACEYVGRAASFGFVRSSEDPLLKECPNL